MSMPAHKRRSRSRKNRRNPIKTFLSRYSSWFLGLTFLVAGILIGTIITTNKLQHSPSVDSTQDLNTKSKVVLEDSITIEKINKLTKQLIVEQKKTEELSQELSNKNIKLKDPLLKNLNKTNNTDKKSIEALHKVERHQKHVSGSTTTIEQTDYYNKVRVSLSKSNNKESNLQSKVNNLIEIKPSKRETNSSYINKLAEESKVRINEGRTIRLKKGDSLWSLSKRAYGKGIMYTKILDANPQLTKDNIQKLQTGTVLRVPQ